MDLWTARLWASRAVLPWITTRPLPTAPPSDHNSTDPKNQDLFYMGFKGETRSLIFELIDANTLCSWFRPFCGEKVNPPPQIQAVSKPTVQQAFEYPNLIPFRCVVRELGQFSHFLIRMLW
jgi:hypothetical protein